MPSLIRLSLAAIFIALAGCASTQPPVPLNQTFYNAEKKTVGLMLEAPEAPGLALEGNIGLLDYAIISAATSSLSKHIESQDLGEFLAISEDLAQNLESEGFTLKRLETPGKSPKLAKFKDPDPNDSVYYADKDHRGLAEQYQTDYLLKLTATRAGLARPYYGPMPTDAPRAEFRVRGELIDLSSNHLLWYDNISHSAYADGEWDEAPSFPGLTNSYYVVMNKAKQDVIAALAKNQDAADLLARNSADDADVVEEVESQPETKKQ